MASASILATDKTLNLGLPTASGLRGMVLVTIISWMTESFNRCNRRAGKNRMNAAGVHPGRPFGSQSRSGLHQGAGRIHDVIQDDRVQAL